MKTLAIIEEVCIVVSGSIANCFRTYGRWKGPRMPRYGHPWWITVIANDGSELGVWYLGKLSCKEVIDKDGDAIRFQWYRRIAISAGKIRAAKSTEETQEEPQYKHMYYPPKLIWLMPWCYECDESAYLEGRLWCPEDAWGRCSGANDRWCHARSIPYELVEAHDVLLDAWGYPIYD